MYYFRFMLIIMCTSVMLLYWIKLVSHTHTCLAFCSCKMISNVSQFRSIHVSLVVVFFYSLQKKKTQYQREKEKETEIEWMCSISRGKKRVNNRSQSPTMVSILSIFQYPQVWIRTSRALMYDDVFFKQYIARVE